MRRLADAIVAIAAVALLTAGLPADAQAPETPPSDPSPCLPHPEIEITEEEGPQGFILDQGPNGQPIYRPGSGVVDGNGTAEDPYVIEGWCLGSIRPGLDFLPGGVETQTQPALLIENTEAHVVVRSLVVVPYYGHGLVIRSATNVTLKDNYSSGFGRSAIELDRAHNVTVQGNHVEDSSDSGIHLRRSHDNRVIENTVEHNHHGLTLHGSQRNLIADNRFVNNDQGHTFDIKHQIGLKTLYTSRGAFPSSDNRVVHNEIVEGDRAIEAAGGPGSVIEANEIVDNLRGIATGSLALEIHRNNINGTEHEGLETKDAPDAEHNWWGCPEGPSDPACDGVEGAADVDPWLEEPNADAGPRTQLPSPLG